MKALLRGFVVGFGFALGASVAGTLIGYAIGRIGEASVKRLLSPEQTSSPSQSFSPTSSEPQCDWDTDGDLSADSPEGRNAQREHCRESHVNHDHLPAEWWCCEASVCRHTKMEDPPKIPTQQSSEPLCGEFDDHGHSCTRPAGHEGYHADMRPGHGYHGPMQPTQHLFSCGHCGFTSPFQVAVTQHAAEKHADQIPQPPAPPAPPADGE